MARRYDLSNRAMADLRDIWNYTFDRWGEQQAEKYYRGIIKNPARFKRLLLNVHEAWESPHF